jgi:uncharacterized protein YjiS (DUF1127 family)
MSNRLVVGLAGISSIADPPGRLQGALPGLILMIVAAIGTWAARSRQRRALADLADRNDYLLADIGVTREQARREAAKPFWVFCSLTKPRR